MTGVSGKKPLPCPFCAARLELSGDGTQWRHPGSMSLQEGCLLRGRRISEDEIDEWNQRTVAEESLV